MGNGNSEMEAGTREKKINTFASVQWRIYVSKSILLTGVVEADAIRRATREKD